MEGVHSHRQLSSWAGRSDHRTFVVLGCGLSWNFSTENDSFRQIVYIWIYPKGKKIPFWIDRQGISVPLLSWHRRNQFDSWLAESWVCYYFVWLGDLQSWIGGGLWVAANLRRTASGLGTGLISSHSVSLDPRCRSRMRAGLILSLCQTGLSADSRCSDVFSYSWHLPGLILFLIFLPGLLISYTFKIFLRLGPQVLKRKHTLS